MDSTWSDDYDASRYRWRSQEGSETDDLAVSDNFGVGLEPPVLVYMQTRHYDPALGRFIMADSIPMGAFSPQGLNRYAYCTNDPVNASDPEGCGPFLALLGAMLLGALIGGIIAGIVNAVGGNSFWNGFAGGAVMGALATLGPAGAIIGAFLGGVLTSKLNGDSWKRACLIGLFSAVFAGFGVYASDVEAGAILNFLIGLDSTLGTDILFNLGGPFSDAAPTPFRRDIEDITSQYRTFREHNRKLCA